MPRINWASKLKLITPPPICVPVSDNTSDLEPKKTKKAKKNDEERKKRKKEKKKKKEKEKEEKCNHELLSPPS